MIDIAVQYGDLIRAMTHTSKVDNNLVVVAPMALSRLLLMFLLHWTANLTKGEIELTFRKSLLRIIYSLPYRVSATNQHFCGQATS